MPKCLSAAKSSGLAGIPEEPHVYNQTARYCPTNVAFAPDGGFYVGDGYGSSYIHQYDKNAQWVRTWGGEGEAAGKLRCPHGLWLDDRPGRKPLLVVADRATPGCNTSRWTACTVSFTEGLTHPCHFSLRGSEMLVADLHSRLTILDGDNRLIVHRATTPHGPSGC